MAHGYKPLGCINARAPECDCGIVLANVEIVCTLNFPSYTDVISIWLGESCLFSMQYG